jgi:hypothetical protein
MELSLQRNPVDGRCAFGGADFGVDVAGEFGVRMPGDANKDGLVNASDATILAGNWQSGTGNVATVVLCGFDGKKLTYKEHGTELAMPRGRGFCEPSLAEYQSQYFLTLRTDHSAFVARSNDGLHFDKPKEWIFDDGKVLGSYNTQQHWVVHPEKGLHLVYTRRGANNNHVMRHRAPLFMAKVDPKRLCVLRDTERVLLPENSATMGNFGVVDVTPSETWVVVSEFPRKKRKNNKNQTLVAKIHWKE